MKIKQITIILFCISVIWIISTSLKFGSTQKSTGYSPQEITQQGTKIILFDGSSLDEWIQVPANSWIIKDGAMASTGAGRGYIYSKEEFSHYRLMFSVRQVKGDHQPCMLVFGTPPKDGEKGLDALGAIQLQPPNGGHWDYREGRNNSGGELFTRPVKTIFDYDQWSRVEVLVNAEKGTARMAVAQPVGSVAIENLNFNDITAGKKGPVAWQMHNAGIFDEFKDVIIEINPIVDDLISTKPGVK